MFIQQRLEPLEHVLKLRLLKAASCAGAESVMEAFLRPVGSSVSSGLVVQHSQMKEGGPMFGERGLQAAEKYSTAFLKRSTLSSIRD